MATKKLIFSKNALSVGVLILALICMTACTSTQKLLEPKSVVTPQSIYKVKPVKFNDGGIWPGDTTKNLLFEDTRARKVGDLVTVVLNETATSTQTATTDTSKSSSIDLKAESMLGLPSNMNVQNFLGMGTNFNPALKGSTEKANKGSGTTTRSGSLTGTLSATIIAINGNGNFNIEGKRSVTVNNEEQLMVLTGTVRPSDINYDNTINSSLIANAAITYSGEGVIADEQRVGWMMRIMSVIWPF
mgnify:CR=1 FL=1